MNGRIQRILTIAVISPDSVHLDAVPPDAAWGVDARNNVLCVDHRALRICTAAAVVSIDTTRGRGQWMQVEVELELLRDCDHNAMDNLIQMASPPPGAYFISCHIPRNGLTFPQTRTTLPNISP